MTPSNQEKIDRLRHAIQTLEAQRGILGDDVVDPSIEAMQKQLADLVALEEPATEQRKLATVMFADVSGFTAIAETMDAEEVQGMMNTLWLRVDKIILDHNGYIDKHIGDAVMALWGTDTSREDDAGQAVRAALAMQETLISLADESGLSLEMRIGINTGLVLLGKVGATSEFTAMGDAVNIASRLEQAAPVGGVLISHNTYRHVRGVFDVTVRESLVVKGKSDTLRVYEVNRVKPRAFRLGTRGVEGLETKMVGRDKELRQLQAAFQSAASQPQTILVSLVGEAGVGKSRLMYEFNNWLELRPETVWYFKGRASQHLQNIPQYLLRDLLAPRFQMLESDSLGVMRAKFTTGISEFLHEEAEKKAHILGTWLGYNFWDSPHLAALRDDPEQIKNRASMYLAQFFTAVTAHYPVVILLEDIHWADGGSLEALLSLCRRRPELPLLIIGLARPSLYEQRPDWDEMLPGQMRIELAALSSVDTRSLVAEILRRVDPLPEVVLDLVSVRAEGNPFYAEELVKMLIDDGVIVADSETWRVLPEPFLELKVPDTLTGVLQARLDKLQPPEKLAIQQAAVIGRIFWDEALAALHSERVDALPTLEVRELVFRREESAFEGTVEYIFKHSILRDVTYETVLKRLRGQYHNLVAGWLAAAAEANNRAEEYAALIGKHYQLGGSLKQAADWYERAGKQAMITFAHAEAVYYLTQALQFTAAEAHASRFTLLEARERAYHMQGDREAQSKDLAALAILADSLGKAQQTRMALRQAEYATATSNYAQAMQYARMAIELAQGGQDIQATAEGHYAWGTALYRQGQYTAAQEQYQLGLQLAREAGNRKQMANCQIGLGNVTNDKGDFAAAMRYYQDALAIWRAAGSEREEASSLNGLGVVAYYQGDFTASRQYYEQSLAIQSRIGNRFGEVVLLTNLGLVAADQGDLVAAKVFHEQSLAISREIDDRYGEGASLSNLAGTLFSEGDYSTAKVYLEQALVIQKAIGDQWGEGNSLNELGAIALVQDNLPQAEQCYQQALAIHQRLNLPHYLAEDRAGLTRVWLAQGKPQKARSDAQQILDYLQNNARLEGTENPIRALCFTWETLTELGETAAAQGVLESAAEIMKAYLDKHNDPALQAKYLRQLHHQVLWSVWTNVN